MKLNDFLESTYFSTNLELQSKYSVSKQSKTQACQSLISAQRRLLKIANYFILIGHYLLVSVGLLAAPSYANELIKEFNDKLVEEKKKLAQEKKDTGPTLVKTDSTKPA